jgi:hypothetical protein
LAESRRGPSSGRLAPATFSRREKGFGPSRLLCLWERVGVRACCIDQIHHAPRARVGRPQSRQSSPSLTATWSGDVDVEPERTDCSPPVGRSSRRGDIEGLQHGAFGRRRRRHRDPRIKSRIKSGGKRSRERRRFRFNSRRLFLTKSEMCAICCHSWNLCPLGACWGRARRVRGCLKCLRPQPPREL